MILQPLDNRGSAREKGRSIARKEEDRTQVCGEEAEHNNRSSSVLEGRRIVSVKVGAW